MRTRERAEHSVPGRSTWRVRIGWTTAFGVVCLLLRFADAAARTVAVGACLYMAVATAMHAWPLTATDTRARRWGRQVAMVLLLFDPAAPPRGPKLPESPRARRDRRIARRAVLVFAACSTGIGLGVLLGGSPYLALVAAAYYVRVRYVLPASEHKAGVEQVPSAVASELSERLRVPSTAFVATAEHRLPWGVLLAPLLVLLVTVGGLTYPVGAGVVAQAVGVASRVVKPFVPKDRPPTTTPTTTPTPRRSPRSGPGAGGSSGATGTPTPGQSPLPTPSADPTAHPTGSPTASPRPAPPPCATDRRVLAALRALMPPRVAVRMAAAWHHLNWPALGCVVAGRRMGRAYAAVVQGASAGDGLLTYVRGHAVAITAELALPVELSLPELVDLSSEHSFRAGVFAVGFLPRGRCRIFERAPNQPGVVIPTAVSVAAVRLAAQGTGFPLIRRAGRLGDRDVYDIRLLQPVTQRPGYASYASLQVLYNPVTGVAQWAQDRASDETACSTPVLTLRRAAWPIVFPNSAQR